MVRNVRTRTDGAFERPLPPAGRVIGGLLVREGNDVGDAGGLRRRGLNFRLPC